MFYVVLRRVMTARLHFFLQLKLPPRNIDRLSIHGWEIFDFRELVHLLIIRREFVAVNAGVGGGE